MDRFMMQRRDAIVAIEREPDRLLQVVAVEFEALAVDAPAQRAIDVQGNVVQSEPVEFGAESRQDEIGEAPFDGAGCGVGAGLAALEKRSGASGPAFVRRAVEDAPERASSHQLTLDV